MNETITETTIKGMVFRLSAGELRQLILDQQDKLSEWLDKAPVTSPKWSWRASLHDMLSFGAEHLDPNATYELSRYEVQSLFEGFDD